jgi:hypothetical protein
MMSRGFKPVGWVASVAGAALGCYMLSLNVASERAELAKLERSIIMTKKEIRSLETELGTRGRLQQLESWNANVLALSAPTSAQFLDNAMTLARFDQREKTLEERSASVQLASADTSEPSAPQAGPQAPVRYAAAPEKPEQSLVHRASFSIPETAPALQAKKLVEAKPAAAEKKAEAEKPVKASKKAEAEPKLASLAKKTVAESKATARKSALIDEKLVGDIKDAAKAEKSRGAGGQ